MLVGEDKIKIESIVLTDIGETELASTVASRNYGNQNILVIMKGRRADRPFRTQGVVLTCRDHTENILLPRMKSTGN